MKVLAEVKQFQSNVIPFPQTRIVQFPLTQLCGCGCNQLINIEEHIFIRCEVTNQWYVNEDCFLESVKAVEKDGRYYFLDDSYDHPFKYTKNEFYNELLAYWMNDLVPIA